MVTCTGHIGIHEGADGRTLYVRTDVHDVMAIKLNFLTSMGYHIFLSMVLRARAPLARAELRYYYTWRLLFTAHFDGHSECGMCWYCLFYVWWLLKKPLFFFHFLH